MPEDKTPITGSRFITSPKPAGFEMQLYADANGTVSGTVVIDANKQGPPEHAHGGSLVTLLDEVMGIAAWYQGHRVMVVNLNINFRCPVPLHQEITATGKVSHTEGRKVFGVGTITLPDGTVAVEATGIFVEAPEVFDKEGFTLGTKQDGDSV